MSRYSTQYRRARVGETLGADQVVGKTLIAQRNVPIKRMPSESAPVVYTAKAGQTVGIVYSWVTEGPSLYWQFLDEFGKPYYSLHRPGYFSLKALQAQGAETLEDIREAEQEAQNPIAYNIQKLLKPVAAGAALFLIIKAFR